MQVLRTRYGQLGTDWYRNSDDQFEYAGNVKGKLSSEYAQV